jgi:aspartyl-tRNA(Asn)/glutamyl-tRNA(Gln) amidotransferase subunit C
VAVTVDDVRHIAQLARLGIDDTRARTLVEELNRILEHMAVLARVDTARVPPAAGISEGGMPLREDCGEQLPLAHPREAFAPEMRDGFFLVPRLETHESAVEELE